MTTKETTLAEGETAAGAWTAFLIGTPLLWWLTCSALSQMWGWHAVPLGAPPLTAWQFVGLMALVGLARFRMTPRAQLREYSSWYRVGMGMWAAGSFWAIAYLAHRLGGAA